MLETRLDTLEQRIETIKPKQLIGIHMEIKFKIMALQSTLLDSFKSLSERELKRVNARWIDVDECPGYPCRVSLEDAKVGERVLAFTFTHHDVNSPYKSSGPIFIRENAKQAIPLINEIPLMLRHRQMSLRGYSAEGMMIEAEVAEGMELEECIVKIFKNPETEYIHIHNAKPGCFNCCVVRA